MAAKGGSNHAHKGSGANTSIEASLASMRQVAGRQSLLHGMKMTLRTESSASSDSLLRGRKNIKP